MNTSGGRRILRAASTPVLLALFPVLSFFAANYHEFALGEIVGAVVLVSAGALLFLAVAAGRYASLSRAVVFSSAAILLSALSGHLGASRLLVLALPTTVTAGGFLLLSLLAAFWLERRTRAHDLGTPLFVMGLILTALPLSSALWQSWQMERHLTGPAASGQPRPNQPDIYYIILDGYGRADVLREFYGFDNEPFVRALEHRGFRVPRQSFSNYSTTLLSLASSLNLRYLPDADAADRPARIRRMYGEIENSALVRWALGRGYTFVHIGSGGSPTRYNHNAQVNLCSVKWREFLTAWLRTTALRELGVSLERRGTRKRVLCGLDAMDRLSATAGAEPRFVFAHIWAAHPPFVLNQPAGSASSGWTDRTGYVRQLEYVNQRVLQFVDRLSAQARVRPVIVFQADHGPASLKGRPVTPEFLRERMTNFQAIATDPAVPVPDLISTVNLVRLIPRSLGEPWPALPDQSFYSEDAAPLALRLVPDTTLAPHPRR